MADMPVYRWQNVTIAVVITAKSGSSFGLGLEDSPHVQSIDRRLICMAIVTVSIACHPGCTVF